MEMHGGMYPLCCQNDILVPHQTFADFFFFSGVVADDDKEMLSLESYLQDSHKATTVSGVEGRTAGNKPVHSAPRHKHSMCPLLNSVETLLDGLTCDPHQIQESWECTGLESVLVDPLLWESAQ